MFSKTLAVVIAVAAAATSVHAHAGVTPALGIEGQLTGADVQFPSAQTPCGNTDLSKIATSTPVQADADGTFSATAISFNGGKDGSRQFTATLDATGTGTTFDGQVEVTTNGDAEPTNGGSQPLVAQLPAGTKCSGGASGNLCLVAFKSLGGFGNCVVVAQGGGAGGAAKNTSASKATKGDKGAANNAQGVRNILYSSSQPRGSS
ncbi:hypothetical protein L218DRAFT_886903 [Marasmius fiardii PR-910]|nr:hypothetical protein L218DRAFT_886903 [Marasmius fiardii PR-910]